MNSSTQATSIHDHGRRHGKFSLRAMVAALAVLTAFTGATAVGSAQTKSEPREGSWRPTRPMSVVRTDHSLTLLFGGKVLAAAGRGGSGTGAVPLSSAEVFDPKTNLWTPTGSLNNVRWSHSTNLLPNGKVLVAGGFVGTSGPNAQPVTDTAELYDPATGTWSPTGRLNVRRALHSFALLADGRVLVAGGRTCDQPPPTACNFQFTTATSEIYDPATGTWTLSGNMNYPRHTTTAVRLLDNRVLTPAGFSGPVNTSETYNPASGAWTPTGNLNQRRARQGAILLPDGKVLVAAGFQGANTSEIFDPATNTWSLTGNVAVSGRFNFYFSELPNGKALIAGGQVFPSGLTRTSEVYDPATGTWRSGGLMPSTHGSSSSLSNSWEAPLISANPFTFAADQAVCGSLCGAVLVAGGDTAAADLYIPSCAGIPANIRIYCTPA